MKNRIFYFASALMISGALILTGCSKDDTSAPVITLLGSNNVTSTLNAAYVDAGATAKDDEDGDITSRIVTTNPVNKDLAGTYTVRFNVTDAAGNDASEVVRTVNVVNSAAILVANYSRHLVCGTFDTTYVAGITTSAIVNNKIFFTNFAGYTGANIEGTVSGTTTGSTVTIPTQTVNVGNPTTSRTFNGSGFLTATGMQLNHTETTAGNPPLSCVETFTRQ